MNTAERADAGEVEQLRARVRDLEAALGLNDQHLAVTFRLTPVLSNIMGLMLALPNVTPEMIRQRLEIATDAKVAIHRLRKHLKAYSATEKLEVAIDIQGKRNLGYWFEPAVKSVIRGLLSNRTGTSSPPTEGASPEPLAA